MGRIMPTYEYECKSCGHNFDAFQRMSEEPLKICPKCGRELRRLINGGTGVIFKGSGFYVTDKGRSTNRAVNGAAAKTDSANSESSSKEPSKESNTASGAACAGCAKAETCPGSASQGNDSSKNSAAEKKAAG